MRILVCIDDTDNLESRGTGDLAFMIAALMEEQGWGCCEPITRHQLLVHPDIPYTSHNSSMCFGAQIEPVFLDSFTARASEFLGIESASGSDPGLCIVNLEVVQNPEELIEFGIKAKNYVVTKTEAYDLAGKLKVHLSEHGGTGGGVIGALAGAGLRLSGRDGRVRGKLQVGCCGEIVSAGGIKLQSIVQSIKNVDGMEIGDEEKIVLGETVKPVLLEDKFTLLVKPSDHCEAPWQTCSKSYLKKF